jgi:putative DNA primase/helicase
VDQTSVATKLPKAETGEKSKRQGGIELSDPTPWPEPVDGAELLDSLVDTFSGHLALPEGTAEAIALWVLFAHSHDAHQTSPRLAFISPVPECGKTTALSIIASLVPRPLATSNITAAVIFRVIAASQPTLLIDEADTFMHSDDMRGILNSGHTRATAQVWRCEGDSHEPKGFSTWAPIAVAKIGNLPETLESRSIVVQMRRKRPDEPIKPIDPESREALAQFGSMAARWAADNAEALAATVPALPSGLYNRTRDNWRPLIAVADAAGGEWPGTARQAAVLLSGSVEDPSLRIQLLSDIREIFRAERLPSKELCKALGGLEDRPWADYANGFPINQTQLAKLLKPFGITPKSIRLGPNNTPKGYVAAQFEDAFVRYLQPIPPAAATPQRAREIAVSPAGEPQHDPQRRAYVAQRVAAGTGANSAESNACCGVADRDGGTEFREIAQ